VKCCPNYKGVAADYVGKADDDSSTVSCKNLVGKEKVEDNKQGGDVDLLGTSTIPVFAHFIAWQIEQSKLHAKHEEDHYQFDWLHTSSFVGVDQSNPDRE